MCRSAEDKAHAHMDKCTLTLFYTLLLSVIQKAAHMFSFTGEEQLCKWMYNVKQCWRETQESPGCFYNPASQQLFSRAA